MLVSVKLDHEAPTLTACLLANAFTKKVFNVSCILLYLRIICNCGDRSILQIPQAVRDEMLL